MDFFRNILVISLELFVVEIFVVGLNVARICCLLQKDYISTFEIKELRKDAFGCLVALMVFREAMEP